MPKANPPAALAADAPSRAFIVVLSGDGPAPRGAVIETADHEALIASGAARLADDFDLAHAGIVLASNPET